MSLGVAFRRVVETVTRGRYGHSFRRYRNQRARALRHALRVSSLQQLYISRCSIATVDLQRKPGDRGNMTLTTLAPFGPAAYTVHRHSPKSRRVEGVCLDFAPRTIVILIRVVVSAVGLLLLLFLLLFLLSRCCVGEAGIEGRGGRDCEWHFAVDDFIARPSERQGRRPALSRVGPDRPSCHLFHGERECYSRLPLRCTRTRDHSGGERVRRPNLLRCLVCEDTSQLGALCDASSFPGMRGHNDRMLGVSAAV